MSSSHFCSNDDSSSSDLSDDYTSVASEGGYDSDESDQGSVHTTVSIKKEPSGLNASSNTLHEDSNFELDNDQSIGDVQEDVLFTNNVIIPMDNTDNISGNNHISFPNNEFSGDENGNLGIEESGSELPRWINFSNGYFDVSDEESSCVSEGGYASDESSDGRQEDDDNNVIAMTPNIGNSNECDQNALANNEFSDYEIAAEETGSYFTSAQEETIEGYLEAMTRKHDVI